MSAIRFVTSIARAYSGAPDSPGGPDLATARDLAAIAGSRSLKELAPRAAKITKDIFDRKRLTRLAADGGQDDREGCLQDLHAGREEQSRCHDANVE